MESMLQITEAYLNQDSRVIFQLLTSLQNKSEEITPESTPAETVSFGEFVTVMWSLKKENKRPGLRLEDVYQGDIINIKV